MAFLRLSAALRNCSHALTMQQGQQLLGCWTTGPPAEVVVVLLLQLMNPLLAAAPRKQRTAQVRSLWVNSAPWTRTR